MKPLTLLALAVAGGLAGALGDNVCHVQQGVLAYRAPFLFGSAAWVPLLFGASTPFMLLASAVPLRLLPPAVPAPRPGPAAVALPALVFFVAYYATGLFQHHPVELTVMFVATWAARLQRAAGGDARRALELGLGSAFLALGGVATELAVSSTGAFTYARADLGGVPLWLPALYLHLEFVTRTIVLVWLPPRVAGEGKTAPA